MSDRGWSRGVYAAAAAASGGDVIIEGVAPDGPTMVVYRLPAAGGGGP